MSDEKAKGPDFEKGVAAGSIEEGGILAGHVGEEPVLMVRSNGKLHAIGAECTHYHGPLAEGLLVEGTIRCPWHHACFDVSTGSAVGAPAFDPIACWNVEEKDGKAFAKAKKKAAAAPQRGQNIRHVVIVGAGAAGFAAAEMLRREGYAGELLLLSADRDAPYDRPNCSKDYLAGGAPKEWMPLRDEAFYKAARIDLRLNTEVTGLDPKARTVSTRDGGEVPYDALILATGAEPRRPGIEGLDGANVFTLRSIKDADAIIAAAKDAASVAVIGASFIGLEVAAALRERKLEVHVIAPETTPLERIMGRQVGQWVRKLHEEKGVTFHLGGKVSRYADGKVFLDEGEPVKAEFVVAGTGVAPRTSLAEAAGLKVDNGVVTDRHLRTSAPGVYAAGDIARYPDPVSGGLIRVEHWVHAERQGQYVARHILGLTEKGFADPPFFWSQHYEQAIHYSGHAEKFDPPEIDGSLPKSDATISYRAGGRLLAVVTIGRDLESLEAEHRFER